MRKNKPSHPSSSFSLTSPLSPHTSLLSPRTDGLGLFLWIRWRGLRASWRELWHQPVKLSLIVGVWGVLLIAIYVLSRHGLAFVKQATGLFLIDRLWYLLLFVVLIMLGISQLATAYSTLVRSPETAYWLTLPIDSRWIGRAKWLESSCYSAWSVLLLLVPLGLAYVHVTAQPSWTIAWMLALLVPLVGLVTAVMTALLVAWLRWMGRLRLLRRELIPAILVLAWVLAFWLLGERAKESDTNVWFAALEELVPRIRLASAAWMPSAWMSRSFLAALQHRWTEAWVFGVLLWTTALVGVRLLDRLAAAWMVPMLRKHADAPDHSSTAGSRSAGITVQGWRGSALWACVMKDLRLLARDPAQWGQGLVFFGLLGAYFANLHRMGWMTVDPAFGIAVASLNLACTLLVFGSLAVRFVFPQMSLEGRRLWMVHIVPNGLQSLLRAKFFVYSILAELLIGGLLVTSITRLHAPVVVGWWLAVAGAMTGLGLVGLTLGLGAEHADVRATDPARIVSSSSGALALLLMLVHVGLVTAALVVFWRGWVQRDLGWMALASVWVVVANLLLGWWPIVRGQRALERLEL